MGNQGSHPHHQQGQHGQHGQSSQPYPGAYPVAGGYPPPPGQGGYPQGAYGQPQQQPRPSAAATFQQKYGCIPDQFQNVQQVQAKLREVGLESSNLVVAVDFTKSNEWTGKHSFAGRCLHAIGPPGAQHMNPYERAIQIIGETLEPFDEDNLIPCFGFGDVTTHDKAVFAFNADNRPCTGLAEALARYRAIAPLVQLSGPTSFAPAVEAAVRLVEESGGGYHVLVIIADGQVTRSADVPPGQLSKQEKATVDAIVAASNYALSIVLVGVGDGPWDVMRGFDDNLPSRRFDNFQFVDFSRIMASGQSHEQQAALFAVNALMEVPFQFKACAELGMLGKRVGRMPQIAPLPPPPRVLQADAAATSAYGQHQQPYGQHQQPYGQQSYNPSAYGQPPPSQPPPHNQPPPFGQPPSYGQSGYNPSAYGQQPPPPYNQPPPGQPPQGQPPPYGGGYSSQSGPYPGNSRPYQGGYSSGGGASETAASAPSAPPFPGVGAGGTGGEGAARADSLCPVCRMFPKATAFQCGHQFCEGCGNQVTSCPTCKAVVSGRYRI